MTVPDALTAVPLVLLQLIALFDYLKFGLHRNVTILSTIPPGSVHLNLYVMCSQQGLVPVKWPSAANMYSFTGCVLVA